MEQVKPDNHNNNTQNIDNTKKKKNGVLRYVIYISIVLVATGVSLFLSLYKDFNGVINAFSKVSWKWVGIMFAVFFLYFIIDGLIIMIFMRLYTRKYRLHQGVGTSFIGFFYSGITPGASGGQVMQAYTLKKQGCQISNAASLLVMYSILYEVGLLIIETFAVIFKWNLLTAMGGLTIGKVTITLIPLTIIGFAISLSFILGVTFMSYSRGMHNLIMHYGIGFLAKIKILKQPDKTRENLRIQIENFKIELKRLQSNIPVTILILSLIVLSFFVKFSIPWFAGMALNGFGYYVNSAGNIVHTIGDTTFTSFMDGCFLSGYHQIITRYIPIPGSAGISEVFFSNLFQTYYSSTGTVNAAQILWRVMTFYVPLLLTGLFSAFYKAKPSTEQALQATRKTFVTMQYETYEERKLTSDTVYKTSQINRKELQSKLKSVFKITKKEKEKKYILDDKELEENSPFNVEEEFEVKDKNRKDNWRDLDIK